LSGTLKDGATARKYSQVCVPFRFPFLQSSSNFHFGPIVELPALQHQKKGSPMNLRGIISVASCLFVIAITLSLTAIAQTTISTGSVQGTITDPSGAVVANAKVTITNKGTGQAITPMRPVR
jgi:hypothetical protein